MAGLAPTSLDGAQTLVVPGYWVVMVLLPLGAPALVDGEQGLTVLVILNQPHLGGHSHHPLNCHVEEPPARLLMLPQQVIKHPEELKDALFPPGVS